MSQKGINIPFCVEEENDEANVDCNPFNALFKRVW